MYGISSTAKESIGNIVESVFDKIAMQFIGNLPRFKDKKYIVFSSEPNLGLSHLFVQAMQNKQPNELEKDVLKKLLSTADSYIDGIKNKTKASLSDRIDGLVKESKIKNESLNESAIQEAIKEEMQKARASLQTIIEAESTKVRNVGQLMDITRVAEGAGIADPVVFFSVMRDNVTCKTCIELHLMPDKITPRLYRFSELKQGYHKRGETSPSAFGEHPGCRCSISYMSPGWGFDTSGRVKYISPGHSEIDKQRGI